MQPEGNMGNSKPIACEFCKNDSVIFDTGSFEYLFALLADAFQIRTPTQTLQ